MNEDDIRKTLSGCTLLSQLLVEANRLKREGCDEKMVNKLVLERRKVLVTMKSDVKKLDRILVTRDNPQKISSLSFQVLNLSSSNIKIEGNQIFL